MARPRLPAYFDGLIAAYRDGLAGRDVHLGYWRHPPELSVPCAPGEFTEAQARLTEKMIDLAPIRGRHRVLDVACGLGGSLAMLAASRDELKLTGLNIDRRQLEICRSISPPAGGSLNLVEADACALPFAALSFDQVLCIEAMFHFRSRRSFLAEAARVLRPGGRLVLSDILLCDPGAAAPWPAEVVASALQHDYGPWPEPWVDAANVKRAAAAAGLTPDIELDWTAQTLPSHRITAPQARPELQPDPDAGQVLRWLHRNGWLAYQVLVFRRQPR